MVILTLIDDEGEECCGYEVRNCSQKGRGVFATKGKLLQVFVARHTRYNLSENLSPTNSEIEIVLI